MLGRFGVPEVPTHRQDAQDRDISRREQQDPKGHVLRWKLNLLSVSWEHLAEEFASPVSESELPGKVFTPTPCRFRNGSQGDQSLPHH